MPPKVLTGKNFILKNNAVYVDKSLSNGKPGMLLIYADWCPHCHHFLPVFNEIDNAIGKSFSLMSVENAQLEKYDNVSNGLNIESFPTIKFFDQNGKIISTYDGNDRSKKSILDHICKVYHHCMKYH